MNKDSSGVQVISYVLQIIEKAIERVTYRTRSLEVKLPKLILELLECKAEKIPVAYEEYFLHNIKKNDTILDFVGCINSIFHNKCRKVILFL